MRAVWMAAETRVRTCDELAMAAQRLRLASLEEAQLAVMRNPVVVLPEEVWSHDIHVIYIYGHMLIV